MSQTWFEELDAEQNLGMKFRLKKHLFSKKSPFQQVDVYDTVTHGKLLAHDGLIMVTEKDEFIYHDMITHVPMMTHPNPEKVLIIGGGDGGTAREVLRYKSVKKCVMVEIDPVVVDASREWIPQTSCEFNNPRLEILIQDGVDYMKSSKDVFDVIIVDSSDPIGPATPLFNIDFYQDVFARLSDNGIVVSQCESPYYHQAMQKTLLGILKELFPRVHLYTYTNLSYPGGYWAFSFASKKLCPLKDLSLNRVKKENLDFQYYNSQLHWAAFQLPSFLQKEYQSLLTPLPEVSFQKT
ncbi:polyamine aminopropyltransferase [bacterium]|nr:polyamine aminopropyltransferase [bacterium]